MRNKLYFWLAWLLPRGLVYWAFVRVATCNCTVNPTDRTVREVLQAWHNN